MLKARMSTCNNKNESFNTIPLTIFQFEQELSRARLFWEEWLVGGHLDFVYCPFAQHLGSGWWWELMSGRNSIPQESLLFLLWQRTSLEMVWTQRQEDGRRIQRSKRNRERKGWEVMRTFVCPGRILPEHVPEGQPACTSGEPHGKHL